MHDYLPTRKGNRLSEFDYSSPGFYFVTMVTYQYQYFFGQVVGAGQCACPLQNVDKHMELNRAGQMIQDWWYKIPQQFLNVNIIEHIIMPNHVHGVIEIIGQPQGVAPTSMSDVVHWFKTKTTNDYIHGVHAQFWPEYEKRFWQRNYYDHIVRGQEDLNRIREYIRKNPENWDSDKFKN